MKIKVISWNIWGGKNLERIIDFLETVEWDIVALQEVTERNTNNSINDANEIAKKFNCEFYFAKAFRTDRHFPVYDLGNAIISKMKIKDTQYFMLSDLDQYERNSTTEPRNAVQIKINTDNSDLNLISTHLGFDESLGEGDLQNQQLSKLLNSIPKERTVLLGDFNSTPASPIIKKTEKIFNHTDHNATEISWTDLKKSHHPQHRIDYIFISPDLAVTDFKILKSDASDHLPLYAEIEF